ncbi:MAG: cobalt-precorrin-6A reductase [Roseinatronobacter sp.]
MHNILVLGGTTEATALATALAQSGLRATLSLAGRVARPKAQALPLRVGGFGGVAGLATYLRDHAITHLVDATHPFAAQMSAHAVAACGFTGTRLLALTRAPWVAGPGDNWTQVPDIAAAVTALDRPRETVMLALGRMHLAAFAPQPQHRYILRLVDPPEGPLPLPDATVIVDRGPFTLAGDVALMQSHGVQRVVCKNAGGTGAQAKLEAARARGLPVVMIGRPVLPARTEVTSVPEVLDWIMG